MNVFDRAVELLEKDGWVQNKASGFDGSRCALAALEKARNEIDPDSFLADYEFILSVPNLVRFNDDRKTKYEDVITLLKDGSRRFEDRKGGISL